MWPGTVNFNIPTLSCNFFNNSLMELNKANGT